MSGYLQNGEAIVMKLATLIWYPKVCHEQKNLLVNLVHDEWQIETKNDMEAALHVAESVSQSLRVAGDMLGLRCGMKGSYYNDDHKDYTIGTNWSVTH